MTFVVAEIGVNWDGNFDLVNEMMIESKNIGCDAVKFQSFDKMIVKDHPQKERLMKSSVLETNIETIAEISKKVGIEWFSTPMFPEAVDILNPFVNRFKIRHADSKPLLENTNSEIINRILGTQKEVFVSSSINPKNSNYFQNPKIKWLYVVPKYPAELHDLDFSEMSYYDGYSNHCSNIIAPLLAVILGSKIIEIHITSDKSADFVDNNVSFDYEELKLLLNFITDFEKTRFQIQKP